ncbi:MAG: recombinase family protein [Eubacteriales bacterium]
MEYGYIRVSTKEQNEARQLSAMDEFGIEKNSLYMDKQSGKDFNRPAYLELLDKLQEGDCIVIKSIDRLGRNYDEILEQWRIITKEKLTSIVVLDMPLLDTRKKDKDLTGVFVADLVLQILCYVAQTERENIRQRQAEGIAVAKNKGTIFGRPKIKKPKSFQCVYTMNRKKEISSSEAARRLGVSRSTFSRWKNEEKIKGEKNERNT